MKVLFLLTILTLTACGTEESHTTPKNPTIPTAPTPVAKTEEPKAPAKTESTPAPAAPAPVAAPKTPTPAPVVLPPAKDHTVIFSYMMGDESLKAISGCEVTRNFLIKTETSIMITKDVFVDLKSEQNCSLVGPKTINCELADNYTVREVYCGQYYYQSPSKYESSGNRYTGTTKLKIYYSPELSAWKYP